MACDLFAYGKEVRYNQNYDEMIATTKHYLDSKVSNIYEATFSEDIPDDFEMTPIQAQAVKSHKSKATFIYVQNIKSFVKNLRFPIYFLDFETYQQTILYKVCFTSTCSRV